MSENNLNKSYFEEKYGVRIQPVVDVYPLLVKGDEMYMKIV